MGIKIGDGKNRKVSRGVIQVSDPTHGIEAILFGHADVHHHKINLYFF